MELEMKHSTSPNYKEDLQKNKNYNEALRLPCLCPRGTPTTAGTDKAGEVRLPAEELQSLETLQEPTPRSINHDASITTVEQIFSREGDESREPESDIQVRSWDGYASGEHMPTWAKNALVLLPQCENFNLGLV